MHQLYDWFGLNVALFRLLNGVHAPWWDALMLALTWLGDHARYPYYLAVVLLLAYARSRYVPLRNAVTLAVGYVVTALAVSGLKPGLDFPRPLLALGKNAVVVVGQAHLRHSFPSGHAAFSVLLAASLSAQSPWSLQWGLWAFAVLVCLSRISVGAHFPADVAGGTLLALAAVAAVRALLRRLSPPAPQPHDK